MTTTLESNRRHHFRLEYPAAERPQLVFGGQNASVVDLSEGGVRLRLERRLQVVVGERIVGAIVFANGDRCSVAGFVRRIDSMRGEATLQLEDGVPLARMLAEHRRVIRMYPPAKVVG
jgi:hypothetical protein